MPEALAFGRAAFSKAKPTDLPMRQVNQTWRFHLVTARSAAAQASCDLSRLLDYLRVDSTAVLGYSHGGAIARQLVLDHPTRCSHLLLACSYAFNMTTSHERIEGHLVPVLINVLGMRRSPSS